jgi:hypothetical protein
MTHDNEEPSAASAGSVSEPLAFAVMQPDSYVVVLSLPSAFAMRDMCGGGAIVPLYRQPQPTLVAASAGSPQMEETMADGKGCKCAAYDASECACDADWTPQELIDARAEIERLRQAIRRLAEQDATLSVCDGNVTVTMDGTLTDEERKAVERAISREIDAEWYGGPEPERVTVLRALLERFK